MTKINFGTDGWRAVIAEDFTFDNVRACAQGVANYLKKAGGAARGVVIGYDMRFASEDFAAATAEVLAANDIRVHLCSKAVPTPVVSYAVVATGSAGGVVITASHNPARWNGFKYKDEAGASAPAEMVAEVEKYTNDVVATGEVKRMVLSQALDSGRIAYLNPDPLYIKQLERLVDIEAIRQSRFKIVHDPMYGAGIGYFQMFLQGGKIDIAEINAERNPNFPGINPEPIARNLTKLASVVTETKADIGIANDGDSDRIGLIDEKGNFLNPHQVFALLALYFLDVRGERGPMVKSLCSTDMIFLLGKLYNVPVYETKVGFKYVAPVMMAKDAFIGGEESGGYGFRGHVPERDGVLAGLYFLDFMLKTGKTPSQLLEYLYGKVGPHYYDRIDSHISAQKRDTMFNKLNQSPVKSIAGIKVVDVGTADGFRFRLADDSWLLLRFSGTEPLVRIYAESDSTGKVQKLLEAGKELLGI